MTNWHELSGPRQAGIVGSAAGFAFAAPAWLTTKIFENQSVVENAQMVADIASMVAALSMLLVVFSRERRTGSK